MWGRVLGPTTLGTYSNSSSALRLYNVCILVSPLHIMWLLPAASLRTPLSAKSTWSPIPRPLRPTLIPCRRPYSLSSSQSVYLSCDKIPLAPSSLHPSSPIFYSHTGAPPRLPPYTSFRAFLLVPPSYQALLPPSPIYSDIYAGFCKVPPSHFYCTIFCALGTVILWLTWVGSSLLWSTLGLLWSITTMYLAVFGVPVSSYMLQCYSGNF